MKQPIIYHQQNRGFTIIELMMSLAVFTVGVGGVIAMQKVTTASNQHAKSLATATQIACSWQDQLLAEGTLWRRATGLSTATTPWLANVTTTADTWLLPAYNATRLFGPAFDALGNPLPNDKVQQAQFCVHLNLSNVTANTAVDPGNATIRATIRVLWPRVQSTITGTANFCSPNSNVATIGNDTANFHSLYQTLAIRIHP
jgi:prepilin-type N-terminal cleavage/methylation domain-containing protein